MTLSTGETVAPCLLRFYACKCLCDKSTVCSICNNVAFYDKLSFRWLRLNAERAPCLSLAEAHRRLWTLFPQFMIIENKSNEYQWKCNLHFNHEMKLSCRRHLVLLNIKYHTPFEPSQLIISYIHTEYIKCSVGCFCIFLHCRCVFLWIWSIIWPMMGIRFIKPTTMATNVCIAATIQIYSKILTLNRTGAIETKNRDPVADVPRLLHWSPYRV